MSSTALLLVNVSLFFPLIKTHVFTILLQINISIKRSPSVIPDFLIKSKTLTHNIKRGNLFHNYFILHWHPSATMIFFFLSFLIKCSSAHSVLEDRSRACAIQYQTISNSCYCFKHKSGVVFWVKEIQQSLMLE